MSGNDLLVQTAIIEVGGPLPPLVMYDLIDVRVEQTVGLPSRLSARFFDHEFSHIDGTSSQVGKPAVVKFLNKTGVETKVFDGQIVDLGIEHFQDSYVLEVGALDLSFKLDGAIEPRSFLNMTRADIIKKIAGECGLHAAGRRHARHAPPHHAGDDAPRVHRRTGAARRAWSGGSRRRS